MRCSVQPNNVKWISSHSQASQGTQDAGRYHLASYNSPWYMTRFRPICELPYCCKGFCKGSALPSLQYPRTRTIVFSGHCYRTRRSFVHPADSTALCREIDELALGSQCAAVLSKTNPLFRPITSASERYSYPGSRGSSRVPRLRCVQLLRPMPP